MNNNVFKIKIPPNIVPDQLRHVVLAMLRQEPSLRVQYKLVGEKWLKEELETILGGVFASCHADNLEEGFAQAENAAIALDSAPLCRVFVCCGYVLLAAHPVLPAQEVKRMAFALELTLETLCFPVNPDYPPSKAQVFFWRNFINDKSSANVPVFLRIRAELDLKQIQNGIHELSARHEILRTCYAGNLGALACNISKDNLCGIQDLDLASLDESSRAALIAEKTSAAASCCLDLTKAPWLCLAIKCGVSDWIILLVFSHICLDGWCRNRLKTEFLNLLGVDGQKQTSIPVLSQTGSFKDYCVVSSANERQYSYHKRLLDLYLSYPQQLSPIKHIDNRTKDAQQLRFEIPEVLRNRYCGKCKELAVTPFALTTTAFLLTLLEWRKQDSTTIKISLLNRNNMRFFNTVGCFTNTLFLSFSLAGAQGTDNYIRQVSSRIIALIDAQDLDHDDLISLAEKDGRAQEFIDARDVSFALHEDPGAPSTKPAVEELYISSPRYHPLRMVLTNHNGGKTIAAVSYTYSMIPEGRANEWKDLFLSNLERLCTKSD